MGVKKIRIKKLGKYRRAIIYNYVFRILSLFLSFVLVRVELAYLGGTLYGTWATILSIVSWLNYGDFGIGNGLRNELAVAVGNGDRRQEETIINSVTGTLLKLSGALFMVFVIVSELLFLTGIMETEFRVPMYITCGFFCMNLFLSVSKSIAFSHQMSWVTTLSAVLTSGFSIIGIFILNILHYNENLIVFSVVCGISGVFSNLISFVILRANRIAIPFFTGKYVRNNQDIITNVVKLGMQFFLLQLCGLILDSTDNLMIKYLYGPESVTEYSLVSKVFNAGDQMFAIVLISLWSEVTVQSTRKNYQWIIKEISNIRKIWIVFSLGVLFVAFFFNPIMRIWLGDECIPFHTMLVFMFAIYEIMQTYGAIYVNVANGMSWMKEEMAIGVTGAILNIPLSFFLATQCSLGLTGIKLATFFCRLGTAIILPFIIMKRLRSCLGCGGHGGNCYE